jgi:hypothetical protein
LIPVTYAIKRESDIPSDGVIREEFTDLPALHKRLENMKRAPCGPFSFGVYWLTQHQKM